MRFFLFFPKLLVLFMLVTPGSPQDVREGGNKEKQSSFSFEERQYSPGFPSKKKGKRHQTSFGAEQLVQQPTVIPSSILNILQADKRNQSCLQSGRSQKDIPASWFVASHVWLQNDGDPDLVVLPNNPCLNGANVLPFWIFRRRARGYALVLMANGLVLDLLNTRTRKYRDIRVTSVSSNVEYVSLYKFNGTTYAKSLTFNKPLQ